MTSTKGSICVCVLALGALSTLVTSTALGQKGSASADENYKKYCITCHSADGTHIVPALSFADGTWKHGSSLPEIRKAISEGVKGTTMTPFKDRLSEEEIADLAKRVRAFDKKLQHEADAPR